MTPATRMLLADLSGAFLALLVFVCLVLASAALFLLWRGLRTARREVPAGMSRAHDLATEADRQVVEVVARVVEPQIRLASAWAGLRAGVRAFVGRSGGAVRPDDRAASPPDAPAD